MTTKQALEYVLATGGNATVANFIEDWEPVGGLCWDMIQTAGYVWVDSNHHIQLTERGEQKLAELSA